MKVFLICFGFCSLVACSKTVEWEEEVPLNTGETIWVKRQARYELQGEAGNPLDVKYRPTRNETIGFRYAGKEYRYDGDARIMLLAISPKGIPNLIAKAPDNSWNYVHKYKCAIPFYAQIIPSAGGRDWNWPQQIEPWLYGEHKNLLLTRLSPEQMRAKYTAAERTNLDSMASAKIPAAAFVDKE